MARTSLRRNVPVLIHVLAWGLLGYTLLVSQALNADVTFPTEFWIKQAILFGLLVSAFYLNAHVLVPRLLFRDRTGAYLLAAGAVVGVILLVIWGVERWFDLPMLIKRAFHPEGIPANARPIKRWAWFQPTLLITMLVMGISTSMAVVQNWQADAQLRRDLEQARTTSELSFLKAQINPHFFFNTLNNIYALTAIDVDAAREALHRLSRMMRYVLYETQADTTLLSKEIAFVQDYIQLMELRLTDKVRVTFDQPRPLLDQPVAPMLLLPFVENAFKHGVSALHDSRIYIGIRQEGPQLHMEVRNTVFPDKMPSAEERSGIGLVNTRRRLDLLYPDRYHLNVVNSVVTDAPARPGTEYVVELTLQLADRPATPVLTA